MSKSQKFVVVTGNKNKLKEFNKILGTNYKLSKIEIPEIQSLDLDEVISQKAKAAYAKIKKPVIVDDVSLNIKELKGLPGTFVKFFIHTIGTEGTVKLLKNKKRKAIVTGAIAIYDGKKIKIFKDRTFGTLIKKDKGKNGFGFDTVFVPDGYKQTYAQMSPDLKNKVSHRAKALKKLKIYLNKIDN